LFQGEKIMKMFAAFILATIITTPLMAQNPEGSGSSKQSAAAAEPAQTQAQQQQPVLAQSNAQPVNQQLVSTSSSNSKIENPRIFIAPSAGFESYLAAAFTKKHVPAQIVADRGQVNYILSAPPVQEKPESAGGKIARCLFAYCAGIEGSQTASVTLTDVRTNVVVWAYNVRKQGSTNYQSSAEACAKHLKEWLERKGN
jgi:hypothetical protein